MNTTCTLVPTTRQRCSTLISVRRSQVGGGPRRPRRDKSRARPSFPPVSSQRMSLVPALPSTDILGYRCSLLRTPSWPVTTCPVLLLSDSALSSATHSGHAFMDLHRTPSPSVHTHLFPATVGMQQVSYNPSTLASIRYYLLCAALHRFTSFPDNIVDSRHPVHSLHRRRHLLRLLLPLSLSSAAVWRCRYIPWPYVFHRYVLGYRGEIC